MCPRNRHCISRRNIDQDALRVLYRLSDAGFTAYLVGGGVRDLLLGRVPKDFDVATNAHPKEIKRLFRNCFLVGKRFQLARIVFGRKVIETSTFRRSPVNSDERLETDELYQREDNTFGTPEEDAWRRDFTVNGLFYDIKSFAIIDYVGGLRDIERKTLRSIGDPNIRFREDPVRMLRAVRLAARTDFRIDWASRRAIKRHCNDITKASVPRLVEEIMRLFAYRSAEKSFRMLLEYGLLEILMPHLHEFINSTGGKRSPLWNYLRALDSDRLSIEASNGLRLAALHYQLFLRNILIARDSGQRLHRVQIAQQTLAGMSKILMLPKATVASAAMLLDVMQRFDDVSNLKRRQRFVNHAIFPEALALRRIYLAAEGYDATILNEWEALCQQAIHSGKNSDNDHPKPNGRRRFRPRRSRITRAEQKPV